MIFDGESGPKPEFYCIWGAWHFRHCLIVGCCFVWTKVTLELRAECIGMQQPTVKSAFGCPDKAIDLEVEVRADRQIPPPIHWAILFPSSVCQIY